ncbi:MAG: hypothetical protein ER33_09410 [Cyanobium sp. CACIAM 14]|nr:MAG: hypothetical protein ER33_09410 [Cyanobium sp. CACIAM 14]
MRNPLIGKRWPGFWRIFSVALILFCANQLLEQVLLRWLSSDGLAALCQLDCHWYADIASQGYERLSLDGFDFSRKANLAFFPLFPLLAHGLARLLGLQPITAILLTGKAFFLLSIFAVMLLGRRVLPDIHPVAVGSVAAFNPYAIYGNTGYTESLYLFLGSVFFILLLRGAILRAAAAGALLSAVRLVGVIAFMSALIVWVPQWKTWSWRLRARAATGLALIPFGLLLFMWHLQLRTGDPLAFIHIQKAWGRSTPTGFLSWASVIGRGLTSDWWLYRYWALSGIAVLLICLAFIANRRHASLAVFSLLSTLVPLSSDCWGLTRYIWWQPPVLLFIACVVGRRRITLMAWLLLSIAINVVCYKLWFSPVKWYIS